MDSWLFFIGVPALLALITYHGADEEVDSVGRMDIAIKYFLWTFGGIMLLLFMFQPPDSGDTFYPEYGPDCYIESGRTVC